MLLKGEKGIILKSSKPFAVLFSTDDTFKQNVKVDVNNIAQIFTNFNTPSLNINNIENNDNNETKLIATSKKKSIFSWENENYVWITHDKRTGWFSVGNSENEGENIILNEKIQTNDKLKYFKVENNERDVEIVKKTNFPRIIENNRKKMALLLHSTKWNENNTVKELMGLTLVCDILPSSQLYQIACEIHSKISQSAKIAPYIGLLPPKSFHMTIKGFKANVKNEENLLREFGELNEKIPKEILNSKFQIESINKFHFGGCGKLILKPTKDSLEKLKYWRESLENLFGLSYEENYEFHITLFYVIFPIHLSVEMEEEVNQINQFARMKMEEMKENEIDFPRFCYFRDMNFFHSDLPS